MDDRRLIRSSRSSGAGGRRCSRCRGHRVFALHADTHATSPDAHTATTGLSLAASRAVDQPVLTPAQGRRKRAPGRALSEGTVESVPAYRIGDLVGVGAELLKLEAERTRVTASLVEGTAAAGNRHVAVLTGRPRQPVDGVAGAREAPEQRTRVRVAPRKARASPATRESGAESASADDGALLSVAEEVRLARLIQKAQQLERVHAKLVDERTAEQIRATEALGAIGAAALQGKQRGGAALPGEPTDGEWARAAGLPSVAALRDAMDAGARARDVLVSKNMGLVYQAANTWRHSSRMALLDLIQEGAAGLVRATELFDPDRGLRFSTYATPWVSSLIRRAIQNKGRVVRLPVGLYESQAKLLAARSTLRSTGVSNPEAEQLAQTAGLTLDQVASTEVWFKKEMSLDDLAYGRRKAGASGKTATLEESVVDGNAERSTTTEADNVAEQDVAAEMARLALLDVLNTLLDRERMVLMSYFGLDGNPPANGAEIARRLRVSASTVTSLINSGMSKLRHPQRAGYLQQFAK